MRRRTCLNLERLEGRSLLSGMSYSLTTDQSTYLPGQPVQMTFQETNDSSQPISVPYGPSTDGFTVVQAGSEVWRSNAGINPLFIVLDTLQPGQSLTLTATWDGIPTGGSAPATGRFVITNQLAPQAASATVTISSSSSPASTGQDPPPKDPGVSPTPSATPGRSHATSPASPPVPDPSAIALTIHPSRASLRAGRPIRITAVVHNDGRSRVDFAPDSDLDGFSVLDGSNQIWHVARSSRRKLGPGQTAKITVVWNGRLATTSATAPPGTYTIEAIEGDETASTTIRLTS